MNPDEHEDDDRNSMAMDYDELDVEDGSSEMNSRSST